jgi:riboflavin synthase
VASLAETEFVVSVIPHTLEKTTLDEAAVGQRVNLEFDLLGKYVENLVRFGSSENNGTPLTVEKLKRWGYA